MIYTLERGAIEEGVPSYDDDVMGYHDREEKRDFLSGLKTLVRNLSIRNISGTERSKSCFDSSDRM